TKQGTIYWSSDPAGWSPYSVHGGPDLYTVRAHLASGSYTTSPIESLIKTDILLFQYCSDITSPAQTFVFAVPPPTAVALVSFEGRPLNEGVELRWETASELQNLGFHLYRSRSETGPYERITLSPIPGLGSSPQGASYRYVDSSLVTGVTYFYELEDIDTTGKTKRHGPVSAVPREDAPPPKEDEARASSLVYGDPSRVSFVELERSSRSLVLELRIEGFEADVDEDGTVNLTIPGFSEISESGAPDIPVKRSWVEVPSDRRVRVDSVRADGVEVFSSLRPSTVGAPELVATRTGTVRASRRRVGEGEAFRGAGLFPDQLARLLEVGYQGDVKKAHLELSPFRWDRTRGELVLARRLVVRLSFAGREARHRESRSHGTKAGPRRRLATVEPGLYGARFEEVMGRGSRAVSTAKLSLTRGGEAVGFHLEPDRAFFGPGSVLYFVSEGARENPYGQEAVYELSVGVGGERMELVPTSAGGSPLAFYWERVEREENRFYQAGLLEAPDLWFWDLVMAPGTKSFSFEASELAATSETGRLSLRLQGVSDSEASPDHHLRVRVNGVEVGDAELDGKASVSLDLPIAWGILREGENELELENVGDTKAPYSMVMLDRFEVTYARRLKARAGELRGRFTEGGEAVVEGLEGSPLV
ncbi:MAG: C25 family peptidase propeptide domain-containing protein, partial [Vicinamibacteria bacterium]